MASNELLIVIPDPYFNNEFPWLEPKCPIDRDKLDWRDSKSKISKDKPIKEFAIEYFERNFNPNHVVCFHLLIEEIEERKRKGQKEEIDAKFISLLFAQLFEKEFKKGIRAALDDYDLSHHASLLKYELQEFIENNRAVIFCSELNLIFIVRVAFSADSIEQECQNCSIDVKNFLCVNKPIIENEVLTVLGVVACPSVKRENLKEKLAFQFSIKFKLFEVLFICKDELISYNTLNDWWGCKFLKYCYENFKKPTLNNETLFKQLIGLAMLVIANNDESWPTLDSSTQKQITTMFFNYEQMVAIRDRNLKKVITGGFGSGKSIVGKEIVKRLYKEASKPTYLYYICCDHFSLFECEMKKFVDSLKNRESVTIFCENLLQLWRGMHDELKKSTPKNISLPELLHYYGSIKVNASITVNFVLDELSGEYVKEENANQLKKLFLSSLKESLVVFIPKSIQKNRSINKDGQKQQMGNNCFDEEKLGMKNITLKSSMRVTILVQLLIDSAQKTISESSTVWYHAHNSSNQIKLKHERDELNSASVQDNLSILSTDLYKQKTNSNEEVTKMSKPFENNNFNATHIPTQQNYPSGNGLKDNLTSYYDDDLDLAPKFSNCQNVVESENYLETYYKFNPGDSGHSIKGDTPKVIYLPSLNWEEERSAKILSVVLKKICFEERGTVKGTVVVCNNMQEVKLVTYAIDITGIYKPIVYAPRLKIKPPAIREKIEVTKDIESELNVLVTDSRAMCGLESEVVIVFVKPEEYYLRHEIIDVCARSSSYLILLVLPSKNTASQKSGTVEEVFTNLPKDLVRKIHVEVSNDQKELCIQTERTVRIYDQNDEFKLLRAEKNFIEYIEDERFKIEAKNKLM